MFANRPKKQSAFTEGKSLIRHSSVTAATLNLKVWNHINLGWVKAILLLMIQRDNRHILSMLPLFVIIRIRFQQRHHTQIESVQPFSFFFFFTFLSLVISVKAAAAEQMWSDKLWYLSWWCYVVLKPYYAIWLLSYTIRFCSTVHSGSETNTWWAIRRNLFGSLKPKQWEINSNSVSRYQLKMPVILRNSYNYDDNSTYNSIFVKKKNRPKKLFFFKSLEKSCSFRFKLGFFLRLLGKNWLKWKEKWRIKQYLAQKGGYLRSCFKQLIGSYEMWWLFIVQRGWNLCDKKNSY